MADRLPSRKQRYSSARAELSDAFRADRSDDAQLESVLRRFEATGLQADRDSLLDRFLPLITVLAIAKVNKNDGADDLDALISDGCFFLIPALPRLATLSAASARKFATRIICNGFWKGRRERQWSGGDAVERENIIRRFRTAYVREHGAMPTAKQVQEHIAQLITNSGIEIFSRRKMVAVSQLGDEENQFEFVDPYRQIDSTAIKHAMRLFKGDERKLFRMALEGSTIREIAARFGYSSTSTASQRVNGLFWRARCNRRLASMLGVVADTEPVRYKNSNIASIRSVPPARLAAG